MAKKKNKPKAWSGKRFKLLKGKLASRGASNPAALAAYIGRKKFGSKTFKVFAKAGRNKKGK